jgi:hypothetical protein
MKMKITFITILLICFAFSIGCSVSLGNETEAKNVSTKSKETGKKKSKKDDSKDFETKELVEKKDKSESKSLLQSDDEYDPVGATKADDYEEISYLNQNGGRIRFKRGESSAVITGKIKNGNQVTYIVGAKAGQTLNIDVTDGGENNDVVFTITAPNGQTAGEEGDDYYGEWRGELPQTGDYKLVFGAIESKNTNFTLYISID